MRACEICGAPDGDPCNTNLHAVARAGRRAEEAGKRLRTTLKALYRAGGDVLGSSAGDCPRELPRLDSGRGARCPRIYKHCPKCATEHGPSGVRCALGKHHGDRCVFDYEQAVEEGYAKPMLALDPAKPGYAAGIPFLKTPTSLIGLNVSGNLRGAMHEALKAEERANVRKALGLPAVADWRPTLDSVDCCGLHYCQQCSGLYREAYLEQQKGPRVEMRGDGSGLTYSFRDVGRAIPQGEGVALGADHLPQLRKEDDMR